MIPRSDTAAFLKIVQDQAVPALLAEIETSITTTLDHPEQEYLKLLECFETQLNKALEEYEEVYRKECDAT